MVNDIQDYTKMVSGNLNLINKTMSLQQCLDTVMLITQQKLGSNTVSLNLTSSPNIPDTIIADEIRITQILVNILDNACKFTKKGTVSLHISTQNEDDKKSHLLSPSLSLSLTPHKLEFTVTDTGSGMSAEQVKNIFTHNPKDGMGFGLLLVKYLIEMFGGNITLSSTPNVGSIVQFNLYVGRKIALTVDQIKQTFENTECLLYSEVRNQPLVDVLDIYGIKTVQVTSLKEFKKRFKTHSFKFKLKLLIFGKSTEDDRNTIIKYFKGSGAHSGSGAHDWWRIITTEKPLTPNEDTYYLPSKDAVADVLTAIITNITETTLPPIDALATTRGRILIAEDNTSCRDILVGFMIKLGYQDIDTVNDGLELYLKLTSDQEYDMVFVSLTIGVLDGFTAVKKYREKTSPGVGTIIIAVTGSISSGLKESCYACGMNGYILKPINMQDITKLDSMRIRRSYDLIKATG
jgi:CheY-like chemotaxis protein/two-component sensor histidine kinase